MVFPNALVSEVATMHYGRHASVSEDRRVSVAVSHYFTQDVLPIVRLVVFTDFVKNNDLLRHVSSPLFAWRNCQTCIGALTRLPPRMEGMKGREPYFLKVLIICTDYEVPGHTGIFGRLAMVVRLWTHVSLSQALTYILAYLCILVKRNRKSPYFRAFSGFSYWIKKFSFPKIKIWFEPTFGARERTRTSTPLRAPAPQAGLSTGFSTRAYIFYSFLPSILRAFSIFKRFRDKQTIPLL